MQEPMRTMLKQIIGITDEDLDRLPPGIRKLLSAVPQMGNYRIIAEVTDAKYCFAGCKPGDKLVFGPQPLLNAAESTCPLCIGAIAPMMERVHIMWDRVAEGVDPNEVWVRHSQCFDPGLEHGGLGTVHFKVYAQKPG
jgi:hypothetical protein